MNVNGGGIPLLLQSLRATRPGPGINDPVPRLARTARW